MTDYEKLMIEGGPTAPSPRQTPSVSRQAVKDHMSIFINFEEPTEMTELPAENRQ